MSEKRFRTRRQWHNTLLAVWASPFVVLSGIFFGVTTGNFLPLWVLLVVMLLGFVIGFVRDRTGHSTYHIVNDKLVMGALLGTRGASPDVRIFNLSIGDVRALDEFPAVEKREKRVMLQDLDNFVFANDCLWALLGSNQ